MDSAKYPKPVYGTKTTGIIYKWKCPYMCGYINETSEKDIKDVNHCKNCGAPVQIRNRSIKRPKK